MVYKVIKGPKDQVRYTRDRKMVSKKEIPANIFSQLEGQEIGFEVSDEGLKLEAPVKECIFCGASTKTSRLLNMQTIYLCKEHYYSESTGKVVQQFNLKEKS